jgi:aspartyl/asparaginyl beta-hydroxylase (cupin superfamily)
MTPSTDDTGIDAIDRLLAAEPRNVLALIRKADHFASTGDSRSASAFYLAALRAAPPAAQVPPDLLRELRRAQETCDRYAKDYKGYLRNRLATQGFDPMRSSGRFARSLDIIFGERRIYLQEPRYYYFPELPNIQFYEREQFPWFDEVEAETDAIRAELLEVMRTPGAFSPYVTGHANRPRKDEQGMLNNPDWSAFFLWKNGEPVAENLARCPSVTRALRNAPLATVGNRSPSVLFSLLKPGTHIPPHNGLVNTRLICHLPLIVPGKCRLRVGNETREWVTGKAWAFDDSIDHEAWNDSDETRVILLFDVWRPELSATERTLVTQLFAAIDAYSGTKPDWEI